MELEPVGMDLFFSETSDLDDLLRDPPSFVRFVSLWGVNFARLVPAELLLGLCNSSLSDALFILETKA